MLKFAENKSRRNFLGLLGLAGVTAAAVAADPEILLWTPGEKTFFIPDVIVSPEAYYTSAIPGAIGNQFLTGKEITARMLEVLLNNCHMSTGLMGALCRDARRQDMSAGTVINIRRPRASFAQPIGVFA